MGIADVKSSQPFNILVADFGVQAMEVLPHQVVEYTSQYQETID